MLQEDDGWEESDGAWELEEAEGMIVGAVRQEGECSWPDACDAWAALDEETEAGIHQVGVGEAETSRVDQEDEQLEAEGLLIEGEEREYVLELLLRETSMEACVSNHSANAKSATPKSKRKRNLERRLHKKARVVEEAAAKVPKKDRGRATDREGKKQATQRPGAERRPKENTAETASLRHHCRPREGSVPHSKSGIVPRSSLLGAGQLGFWEVGKGGTIG